MCQQPAGKGASAIVAAGAAGLAAGPAAATSCAGKVRPVQLQSCISARICNGRLHQRGWKLASAKASAHLLLCLLTAWGSYRVSCCRGFEMTPKFSDQPAPSMISAIHLPVPTAPISCSLLRTRHITDVAELARFSSAKTFLLCASCQQQVVPWFL